MKSKVFSLAAAILVTLVGPSGPVEACGDKFVVLGRGVRAEQMWRSAHPASILIYSNPASRIPMAEKEYRLASKLKQAGHKILVLQDRIQLDEALFSRGFDLVLTDYTDASAVDQSVRAASPDTVVIPVLYKPTAAELADARKQYGCLLRASKKNDDLFAVIDEVMQNRARGAGMSCQQPKSSP